MLCIRKGVAEASNRFMELASDANKAQLSAFVLEVVRTMAEERLKAVVSAVDGQATTTKPPTKLEWDRAKAWVVHCAFVMAKGSGTKYGSKTECSQLPLDGELQKAVAAALQATMEAALSMDEVKKSLPGADGEMERLKALLAAKDKRIADLEQQLKVAKAEAQ